MADNPEYKYIAYIDEAGDDGLKRVRPVDENGSSEWMMLGAALVRSEHEADVANWVSDIHEGLWRHNRPDIHFTNLTPGKKLFVCNKMSELNALYFVLASNKKNMRGYANPFAEKIPSKNWFYCWMTRLLLERITHFVDWHSRSVHGRPQKLKIEYSARGGLSYSQMSAYYEWLRMKGPTKNLFLPLGNLKWDVMHSQLLKVYPHTERAGLQLADCVASSFFKAADNAQTSGCDSQFAKALQPRMCRHNNKRSGRVSGYGVKLMPNYREAQLSEDQSEIFQFYGYPRQWWDPDSFNQKSF